MQPLVDELKKLWVGVQTKDASLKHSFTMRASYLWSVHDFRAYGDFDGWSTNGKLACPCVYGCQGFQLRHGRKACWFDCHRRFLPIDHPFRMQANAFRRNTTVLDIARRLTGQEVEDHLEKFVDDTPNYGKLHN